jgi:hypothetical protein
LIPSAGEKVGYALNFRNEIRLGEILKTEFRIGFSTWQTGMFSVRVVTDIRADLLRAIQFSLTLPAMESVKATSLYPSEEETGLQKQLKQKRTV